MVINANNSNTSNHKIVIPFYLYASIAFLIACVLLLFSTDSFNQNHFSPKLLALTHTMALGWGTMIIMGASHQLIPVLIENKLYSDKLALISFYLLAIGIPLLVYGFLTFNMGAISKWGGRLIILSVLTYVINLAVSIIKSKSENIHILFVFVASVWLLVTAVFGLALIYNFSTNLLPNDSLMYLPMHAHAGIVGWFLLIIIGVGSRLIPMFLISKYHNTKILKLILILINAAMLTYVLTFNNKLNVYSIISIVAIITSVVLFINYCRNAYKSRIKKKIDNQIKISLFSVLIMAIPIIILTLILTLNYLNSKSNNNLVLSYGFIIFFGWMTAIILGMTFKTLPFIIWNKIYKVQSSSNKYPNPNELYSQKIFKTMSAFYVLSIIIFSIGIIYNLIWTLKIGALSFIIVAALYNINVIKLIFKTSE